VGAGRGGGAEAVVVSAGQPVTGSRLQRRDAAASNTAARKPAHAGKDRAMMESGTWLAACLPSSSLPRPGQRALACF
jgi:hypothetical protein